MSQRLLELINEERAKVGAGPLVVNGALAAAARAHAESMAALGATSHDLPGEPSLDARVGAAGYAGWSKLGENVAGGWLDPEAVVALWLASPTHRANLLNPVYNEAGIGHAISSETGDCWVLDLGAR